ncbi:tetratricopeptide repeat protein [Sphingobacterium corticis]|uniref:Tetratricopeptide repeat protein n=1 Tax=Sphingobacterium corticis TaxID=1812823 RepID=A0ABW5NKG3_9SPHI
MKSFKNIRNKNMNEGEIFFYNEDYEKALEFFNSVYDIDNQNWKALNYIGICLTALSRFDEARSCFELSISINGDISDTWALFSTHYLAIQDLDNAEICVGHALRLEGSEIAYAEIAIYYYTIENFDNCEVFVRKSLSINGKNSTALNTLGLLKVYFKLYRDAIKIFQLLTKINPNYSMWYNNLGQAYQLDGRLNWQKGL